MIELRDDQGGHGEVVGQKNQRLAGLGIPIADAPERGGKIAPGVEADRHHGLIEAHAGGFIHGPGVTAGAAEVFLGARNEAVRTQVQAMQSGKIQIAAIHDVERTGLPAELVEAVHVVNAGWCEDHHCGKVALECQQRVQFDGGLVPSERGPRKQRQTQVNGGGVQRVGGGLKFDAPRIAGIEDGGLLDEDLSEVGEEAPVAFFVGVGQRAAGDGLAKAAVIETRTERRQTGFNVAETFAPGQLGESQDEEMFVRGEFTDAAVAVITRDTLVELVFGKMLQELGEDRATLIHRVENRWRAGTHPRKPGDEMKSKKVATPMESPFHRVKIKVGKNLTGHY